MTTDTTSAWTTTDDAVGYDDRLLRGAGLRLRATTDADLPVLGAWNTADHAAMQQDRVKPRPGASVEDMFRTWSSNSASSTDTGFSIVTLDSDELIGHTNLYATAPHTRSATFTIMLGPGHVGRGHGVEATRLMLGYAFAELGLHPVELQTTAFNDRAIRAYEKAGFTVEGRRREVVFHAGRFHDHVLMGVLAREFSAAP
ncbi:GNAT family N-acetyltransferase [Tersicoccus phoenicis]|uniref:GNAT family N-acetyltransferase n=1 Tax=Tersicoccus phoenicis TaxID=554083 RepID=UPI001C46B7F3|nr:GNAT family protein [Tersicoccus phoenicis]